MVTLKEFLFILFLTMQIKQFYFQFLVVPTLSTLFIKLPGSFRAIRTMKPSSEHLIKTVSVLDKEDEREGTSSLNYVIQEHFFFFVYFYIF